MIEFLIISLVFFFLGRLSKCSPLTPTKKVIKKTPVKKLNKIPLGAVKAPNKGELEYEKSGQAEVDKIMEEHLK